MHGVDAHDSDQSVSAPALERGRRLLRGWFVGNVLLSGLFALLWLLARSGPRPSRLAYPCQQAAFTTASLAFGAPLVVALLALRRCIVSNLRSPLGLAAVSAIGLVASIAVWGYLSGVEAAGGTSPPLRYPAGSYRAQVFHAESCPEDPADDRFPCLEALIGLMGEHGLKFYRSPTVTQMSGPDGIIAATDVVVIKINYQWPQRGGTNTDLLSGLIRALVDHPEGFQGEVVVAENAQFASTSNFDRPDNNAQDPGLSPNDVVVHFQNLGFDVSHYDWTEIRAIEAEEYSSGDINDGYVLYPWDSELGGALSYPKFQTDLGTYVSLRDGLWSPEGGSYDRERLKVINVPVLKSHHAVYGVTACVKDYMGVVTGSLGTNSHGAIRNGLLGTLLGEIRPPDLNLLDAIWINANPFSGPATTYAGATRRNELVASVDPVATDMWATSNILIPAFLDNGYEPPWPDPSADPDDPTGAFREYLDNSMSYLLAAGFEVTNDPDQIDAFSLTFPEMVLPEIFFAQGELLEGTLTDLLASDDSRVEIRSRPSLGGANDPAVSITVEGSTSIPSPSELRFTYEGQASVPGVSQRIYLFNHALDEFVLVGEQAATATDSTQEVVVRTNLVEFIGEDGLLRAKIGLLPSGPGFFTVWVQRADLTLWEVSP